MPNHITNEITFICNDNKLEEIKVLMKSEQSEFDFNKLIPMPKTLDIESSSRGDTGLRAYREYIQKCNGKSPEEAAKIEEEYRGKFDDQETWELGKQYYENI